MAPSTTVVTVRGRPKHPYGRRNTYIHPYVRHGLGYNTTDWEESLTVKFRNLPSRERRLYTLTLGYGLRGEKGANSKRRRQPEMSHSHALTLMARFHEMLLHGGRTVKGVFDALSVEQRCVFLPSPSIDGASFTACGTYQELQWERDHIHQSCFAFVPGLSWNDNSLSNYRAALHVYYHSFHK